MPIVENQYKIKFPGLNKSNGNGLHEFNNAATVKLKNIAYGDSSRCMDFLKTGLNGLSDEEVGARLATFGLNEVVSEKAPAWYIQFLQAFIDPFIGVLFILAVVSLITDVIIQKPGERDYTTVAVISSMVMISVLLRFFSGIQE